jgi:PilZ domain-containing protein
VAIRKDVRYNVQCPVAYVIDGKPGQGNTFNLSRGGCAIESDGLAASDDPISLQITFPGQPTPISVELGKIRWATRREFGVEFMIVGGDSKERLDDFLIVVAKQGMST